VTLIVDASVVIKWYLNEIDDELALAILNADEPLVAPDLVLCEVVNAGWRRARQGDIPWVQYREIAAAMRSPPLTLKPLRELLPRAAALAEALSHPIYDCIYIALAEREDATLVTADRRLLARLAGTSWAGRVKGLHDLAG
jgi:predicted nucleic acid-binding protein